MQITQLSRLHVPQISPLQGNLVSPNQPFKPALEDLNKNTVAGDEISSRTYNIPI
jgi:hypothetical protein